MTAAICLTTECIRSHVQPAVVVYLVFLNLVYYFLYV